MKPFNEWKIIFNTNDLYFTSNTEYFYTNFTRLADWRSKSLSSVARVSLSLRASAAPKLEHVPIEHVVVGKSLPMEKVSEQLTKVATKRDES